MEFYRAYIISKDGRIINAQGFHSEDDATALIQAKQYAHSCAVEVWNLGRFVGNLQAVEKTTWQCIFQKGDQHVA